MNALWLFDTCGYVFGPAIVLAGMVALALCLRVAFRSATRRTQRLAVGVAASPVVLGLCGFLFGLAVCWNVGIPAVPWLALGKVCLAGLVVSAVPLMWSLCLFHSRRNAGRPAAG